MKVLYFDEELAAGRITPTTDGDIGRRNNKHTYDSDAWVDNHDVEPDGWWGNTCDNRYIPEPLMQAPTERSAYLGGGSWRSRPLYNSSVSLARHDY